MKRKLLSLLTAWMLMVTTVVPTGLVHAEEDGSMTGMLNTMVTWGIGISGGASLLMCKPAMGNATSFYVFNAAAVAYWAAEIFINDENESDNQKIQDSTCQGDVSYEGVAIESSRDGQACSYEKCRDFAKANADAANKKALFKKAAAVAMLAAAALAYMEKSSFKTIHQGIDQSMKSSAMPCDNPQTGGPACCKGVLNGQGMQKCEQLAQTKVICSEKDQGKLTQSQSQCRSVMNQAGSGEANPQGDQVAETETETETEAKTEAETEFETESETVADADDQVQTGTEVTEKPKITYDIKDPTTFPEKSVEEVQALDDSAIFMKPQPGAEYDFSGCNKWGKTNFFFDKEKNAFGCYKRYEPIKLDTTFIQLITENLFKPAYAAGMCTAQVQMATSQVNMMNDIEGQTGASQAQSAAGGMVGNVSDADASYATSTGEEGGSGIGGMLGSLGGVTDIITGAGMHYDPDSRMVFYGIAGGLLTANAFFFEDAEKKYKEQEAHCAELLETLESHDGAGAEEGRADTTTGGASGSAIVTQQGGVQTSSAGPQAYSNVSCYINDSSADSGLSRDDDCACLGNNSCARFELPDGNSPSGGSVDFSSLPPVAADAAAATTEMANGLTNNNLEGATSAAHSLVNNAARVKALYDDAVKKYNQERIKEGKESRDFMKLHNQIKDGLNKAALNDLKKGTRAYGEFLGGPAELSMGKEDKEKKKSVTKKSKKIIPVAMKKAMLGKVPVSQIGRKVQINPGINPYYEEVDPKDALKNLDFNTADINPDEKLSLFTIITGRYRLTAYPALMEEE